MPTPNPREQHAPPRPTQAANRHEFGAALRNLRRWSKLTQKDLEDSHPSLTDSTISDHERGVRLPRLEWLHAYVTQCLRHRNPTATREYLNAELAHWTAAWTRLEHAAAPPVPAISARHAPASALDVPPPQADNSEPASAPPKDPAGKNGPRRTGPSRRRVVLIGGGTAVAAAVVAGAITTTDLFDGTPGTTPPQFAGSTAPVVPVHASGQVENLRGVEGIDLDTNNRADQEAPGVDISFAATSTHLNAMANRVTFTVLPEAGAEERQRCVTAVDWMRQIPNIYDLTEGRNICVITDEGRFSMLTITKRASAATGTIDFHYTTWP